MGTSVLPRCLVSLLWVLQLLVLVQLCEGRFKEEQFSKMFHSRMRELHDTMAELKAWKEDITILDVGANTGTWSKMIKTYFTEVRLLDV